MSVQTADRILREVVRFVIMYVPRTHFDIAWWMIRRVFINFRFEPVMTGVVETLEAKPDHKFTGDGQSALVWLWIKNASHPSEMVERYNRVVALVKRGQLQVGPSFILPDEFLAPGEAQVRNFLIGRELSVDMGAPEEQTIDHSDVFGHPAQIPQLVADFTGSYLFTRGLTKEQVPNAAFLWEAPNGSQIIGIPHPGGYGNGYDFGRKSEEISLQTIRNFLNNYRARYDKDGVAVGLLCGGGDHTALGHRIAEDIAAASKHFVEIDFVMGTDNDYANALDLDPSKLLVIKNSELYGSGRENILRHVDSTRMYLKQRNEAVFRVLMQAETLVGLALLRDKAVPVHWRSALMRCWSDFLVLQSHDAVTGCHVDDVSDDMLNKYANIEQELHMLMQDTMALMSNGTFIMSHKHRYGLAPAPKFGLWNPLPYARSEVAVVQLPQELQGPARLKALVDGQPAQVQRLDAVRAAVCIEAGSFGTAAVELSAADNPAPAYQGSDTVIRNEYLRIQVYPNGTFMATDLTSGRRLGGLGRLVSQGDRGDEYNRDLIPENLVDSAGVRAQSRCIMNGPLVQELEVTFDFEVPEALDPGTRMVRQGRVTIPVKTILRLRRGSRHIEIETTLINTARDHLLRVAFPTGEKLEGSRALSVFIVQPHPIPAQVNPNWKEDTTDFEPPFTTFSNQGMVIAGPVVSFNRGLAEYEVYDTDHGSELAVTLNRGVSHLSQDDLTTRRGGAGPILAVPGAQGLGEHTYAYTFGFVGRASDVELVQAAQKWQNGFVAAPFGMDTTGILDCQANRSVFSALKPAQDGRGVVLRLWAGPEATWIRMDGLFSKRERLTLAEKPKSAHAAHIAPYEIASVRLD